MNEYNHTHYYKDFIDFYKFVEQDITKLKSTELQVSKLNNFEELFILDCIEIFKARGLVSKKVKIDDAVFKKDKIIVKQFEFFFNQERDFCMKVTDRKNQVKFYILKNLMEVKK